MATAVPRRVVAPTAAELADAADRLAAPATVVAAVLDLLDAGDAPTIRLAALVEQSPELAGAVLRLAAAVPSPAPGSAETVARAVERLGERRLRGLLLGVPTYPIFEEPLPGYGVSRLSLLRHSAEVAAMARSLARRNTVALAGRAYVAGLLHDLGKPVLAVLAADRGLEPGAMRTLADERAILGADHARVGAWVARRWGLAPQVWDALGRHHDDVVPGEPVARLVWLAEIAVHAAAGDAGALARLPRAAADCGLAPGALDVLLVAAPEADAPRRPPGLTDREVEVLRHLAHGATPKALARELGCAPSTVHNHLHNVYRKLGVPGVSQALALAWRRGWVR